VEKNLVESLKRSNFALAFGDCPTGIPGAVAGATAANKKTKKNAVKFGGMKKTP